MSAHAMISTKRSRIARAVRPYSAADIWMLSRPEYSGWNPAPSSSSAPTRPRTCTLPLLGYGTAGTPWPVAMLVALALLAVGYFVFRRLSPHFEDFL